MKNSFAAMYVITPEGVEHVQALEILADAELISLKEWVGNLSRARINHRPAKTGKRCIGCEEVARWRFMATDTQEWLLLCTFCAGREARDGKRAPGPFILEPLDDGIYCPDIAMAMSVRSISI